MKKETKNIIVKTLTIIYNKCNVQGFTYGICYEIDGLHCKNVISLGEYNHIMDYLYSNRPKESVGIMYWWRLTPEGNKQRLEYLKEQISILSE